MFGKTKKERKRNSNIISVIIIVIFIIVYVNAFVNDKQDEESLKMNWIITSGQLTEVDFAGKSASCVQYKYEINNNEYIGEYFRETKKVSHSLNDLKKFSWTVIYDETKYSNSELLLTIEDFDNWNVPYDSQKVIDFNELK